MSTSASVSGTRPTDPQATIPDASTYVLGLREGAAVRTLHADGTEAGQVVLGKQFGRGSIGRVFKDANNDLFCVKLFCSPTAAMAGKIRELALKFKSNQLAPGTAAWPRGFVVSPDGNFVGYIMDCVSGVTLSHVAADYEIGLAKRAKYAEGFAACLADCHGVASDPPERGIVVGDVSLANVVLDSLIDAPRLVDIDAFQVASTAGGKRCLYPVREQREPSPETVGKELGSFVMTSRNDNYLCAVCCFELLFGSDPLSDGLPEEESAPDARDEAIRCRRYPYLDLVRSGRMPDPALVVGPRLAKLFAASFSGPYERIPSASEYVEALEELSRSQIVRCEKCGSEYSLLGGGGSCPYC